MRIGVIGIGVVGNAVLSFFENSVGFDKNKPSDSFESVLETDIVFLCLPTLFDPTTKRYDILPLHETLDRLSTHSYKGLVVIKSTVEPGTTRRFAELFPSLRMCHNPEFLCARNAVEDFRNQRILIVGITRGVSVQNLVGLFPSIEKLMICSSDESESVKLFCNSFYAAKIQIFNEFYDVCQKTGTNFDAIRDIMLSLGWINPMHTEVPGSDGKLSFGGMCFPKDISACVEYLESNGAKNQVLRAALTERNSMRE
jgi:UDPglucose 6-dehydrogenase